MEMFAKQYPGDLVSIHQQDIGVSLRSTPATYLGIADDIRKRFAAQSGKRAGLFLSMVPPHARYAVARVSLFQIWRLWIP